MGFKYFEYGLSRIPTKRPSQASKPPPHHRQLDAVRIPLDAASKRQKNEWQGCGICLPQGCGMVGPPS
jgi:hypothetical protein